MTAASEETIGAFKAMVLDEWTAPATIAGWRMRHPGFVIQLREMADAVIQAAGIRPGAQVLDLASGTGQPALTIAQLVGPKGHVTATDLSEDMLAVAADFAREGSVTNITFQLADAHALPFPDASFDAVTSTIGAMYFVEIGRALSEVRRVLKPGGRVAFACWGAPDQGTYALSMTSPFFKRVAVPPPPPGTPQPFRFAAPGSLAAELDAAGFKQVDEASPLMDVSWPGPPQEAWEQFYDVAVPLQPLVNSLTPEERAQAIDEVIAELHRYYDGTTVHLTAAVVIASGTR
jgi:SAM-dependent methyltransferase